MSRGSAEPVVRDGAPTGTLAGGLWVAGPAFVAVLALALVWPTLLPGVGFWDTAEFQAVPPLLGTLHPTGFPAYALLGWLASVVLQPFGAPAYRMNILSALCVAAAAGVTVILVRQLTGRLAIAVAAGVVLFLTPIAWKIATHADAHALHLLLLAIVFALLVGWESRARAVDGPRPGADRWLVAAAGAYGVAVANHSLALLAAPGIGLFVLAVEPGILGRRGLVARCVGAGLGIAAILYLELPLRAGPFRAPLVYGHPETLAGFAYVVFGQQFHGDLASPLRDLGPRLGSLVDFAAGQLGGLAAVLPLAGVWVAMRRWRYALLTVPTFVMTCSFAVLYENADIARYYLGPLLIGVTWLAILAGDLLDLAGDLPSRIRVRAPGGGSPSALGLLALEVVVAATFVAPATLAAGATARTVDESRDTAAQRWLDTTLGVLAPNAVVISWWSYSTPLWYARDVEGRRTDITIIDDRTRLDLDLGDVSSVIDKYLGKRPVYLIRLPAETDLLARTYRFLPIPDVMDSGLVQVVGRQVAGP
ncbi:MAG TPA: DUF2723 domain-containing protein [Candidatus Limnocylindrales bacterium]